MVITTAPATLELMGASGKRYNFTIHPYGAKLDDRGGVYVIMLTRRSGDGGFEHGLLHVGFAAYLGERFANRQQPDFFRRFGAHSAFVQIGVLLVEDENTRLDTEADLIAAYQPPCSG